MSAHNVIDINYHDEVSYDYDRTIVLPRLITNNVIYSKLLRFVPPGEKMLDLGCGTGHLTSRLARRFRQATAVDHSSGMLSQASDKTASLGLKHVSFVKENALKFLQMTATSEFDFIGCVGFLHHLQQQEIVEVVNHIHRVLKPRGQAIFQEPILLPEGSEPKLIGSWNARSIIKGMKYTHKAPHPDEKPLELYSFNKILHESGFSIKFSMRSWEIFPHSNPASLIDKSLIRLMNFWYGKAGNVYSIICRKSSED